VGLNVTPDHLDWHGSMENYRAAKLRIYPAAERRVVNLDDPLADELLLLAAAQKSGHETAFISHEGVFGDLTTNERFRRTFVEELEALRRQGARARLRALAGRTRAA